MLQHFIKCNANVFGDLTKQDGRDVRNWTGNLWHSDLGSNSLSQRVRKASDNRAIAVSNNAGVRAILVHAIHDRAKQFYEHYGFEVSSAHPMTLMLRLTSVKFWPVHAAISDSGSLSRQLFAITHNRFPYQELRAFKSVSRHAPLVKLLDCLGQQTRK